MLLEDGHSAAYYYAQGGLYIMNRAAISLINQGCVDKGRLAISKNIGVPLCRYTCRGTATEKEFTDTQEGGENVVSACWKCPQKAPLLERADGVGLEDASIGACLQLHRIPPIHCGSICECESR